METSTSAVGVSQSQILTTSEVGDKKTQHKAIRDKFSAIKTKILDHARIKGSVAQWFGAAGMVLGGAILLFSSIASSITGIGLPFGITAFTGGIILIGVGAGSFGIGSGFLAKHFFCDGSSGNKKMDFLKFLKSTVINLGIGAAAGSAVAGGIAGLGVGKLVAVAGTGFTIFNGVKGFKSFAQGVEKKFFKEDRKAQKTSQQATGAVCAVTNEALKKVEQASAMLGIEVAAQE